MMDERGIIVHECHSFVVLLFAY